MWSVPGCPQIPPSGTACAGCTADVSAGDIDEAAAHQTHDGRQGAVRIACLTLERVMAEDRIAYDRRQQRASSSRSTAGPPLSSEEISESVVPSLFHIARLCQCGSVLLLGSATCGKGKAPKRAASAVAALGFHGGIVEFKAFVWPFMHEIKFGATQVDPVLRASLHRYAAACDAHIAGRWWMLGHGIVEIDQLSMEWLVWHCYADRSARGRIMIEIAVCLRAAGCRLLLRCFVHTALVRL